ncbi:MAG: aldolase catalytic domain-containing protein [Clostridiales bacterium]|nr:aldolase catalytic domain-containing protein [Clostridiales bacterium]
MRKVSLLDCTLRDGGYINNWEFGYKGIKDIILKLEQTGIEMIEVGFLKGDTYNPDRSVFPDLVSIKNILTHKVGKIVYVGMLDMSDPLSIDKIPPYDGTSIDGIRVIFKKNKINEAYKICTHIKNAGYRLFVNFVSIDSYTDKEFIESLERFNALHPDGVTIVDTFGVLKRKHFMRLVAIADNNLDEEISLCYHAHNNLQQAFGNAESFVEMNLQRDIVIDACVFGMGRGAGNLNLELFAEYMNDNYGTSYKITPMLEIMDEYLSEFYNTKFWGYSLPLYLSACHKCHPNYSIYLAEKNTLSEKAFDELLKSISSEDKLVFSKEKAELYYKKYMENYIDDQESLSKLIKIFKDKRVLLLAPGKTLNSYHDRIDRYIDNSTIVLCINFYDELYEPSFVFTSNSRRINRLSNQKKAKIIVTSNIKENQTADYTINYSSYTSEINDIYDNSGLIALRLLTKLSVKEVFIAGMDGYSEEEKGDYYKEGFESYHTSKMFPKNELISKEIQEIQKYLNIFFITPTNYSINNDIALNN